MQLEPCPFCGGEAERLELTDEDNFGGSVICCKQCGASSSVHFDRKENLEDGWNRRVQAVQPVPVVKIKPLEWLDHRGHTFPDTWTALTPCGVFEIEERSAGDSPAYFATGPMYAFIADKDSLEEAKAAAQADYERRIRASLTATASAEPVITDELRGQIAYQLTKRLVIDMPTARACVDDALKGFVHAAPLPAQGGKADE